MTTLQRKVRASLLLAAGLLTITACSTSPDATKPQPVNPTPMSTTAAMVPSSLANVGEYGENVYDAAKAGTWTTASSKLSALKDAARQLRSDVTNANTEEDRLDAQIASLDKAVAGKERVGAMREANQVTLMAANMSQPFNPKIPVDVVKLDYYGRELEVWSAAKDSVKLQSTVGEMRATWDRIRPSVESHGGSAEAQQFDGLMTQLQKAKTPANYNQAASALLESVDKLEKVFTK
ncbi:MAG: hypothetical protein M3Y07_05170 [Acidobacteriota bacterium]|nr:hypothetical protein [Acidobacteriota bacterium]